MTKEGVASYKASKAREAASKAAGTGYYKSHGGGGSSGGSVAKSVQYFYNPKTGHTTYRVGGGTPSGVGWQPISKPAGYVGGQSRGVATDVDKARAAAEQQDVEALKAKTTAKEKQVMKIEYALQQGMLSQKAAEKARAQQQELMKDMPEKEPVETAFVIGGKTFVGTYGLKKVYAKPEPEDKAPAIYTGIPTKKKEDKPTIAKRKPRLQESSVPLIFPIQPAPGYRYDAGLIQPITSKDTESGVFLAPSKEPALGESKEPSYSKSPILGMKFDIEKAKKINLRDVDISKVAEYRGQKVTWENVGEIELALGESNVLLQKSLLADQTMTKKQASAIRIGEEVFGDVISFKSKEYAKKGTQFAITLLGVGAAGQVLGSLSKVGTVGKIIKVGSPLLKGFWGVSLASRGTQFASYIREGQTERGLLGFAGLGAEVGGVYVAGKWLTATKGKPITDLYRKAKAPFFERSTAKWQKCLTDKYWTYDRAHADISGQKTLHGKPISQTTVRSLRKGVNKGFFNIDEVGTRLISTGFAKTKGFSNVDFLKTQHHITSDYNIKYKLEVFKSGKKIVVKKVPYVSSITQKTDPTRAIDVKGYDWLQAKKITITPKNLYGNLKYSQKLDADWGRFDVYKDYQVVPTLGEKMAATQIPYWTDTTQIILKTKPKVDTFMKPFTFGKTPKPKLIKDSKGIQHIVTTSGEHKTFISYKVDRTALDRAARYDAAERAIKKEIEIQKSWFGKEYSPPETRTVFVQVPSMEKIPQKIDYGPIATTTTGLKGLFDISQKDKTEVRTEQKYLQAAMPIVKSKQQPIVETKLVYGFKQVEDVIPETLPVVTPIVKTKQRTGTKAVVDLITVTTPIVEDKLRQEPGIDIGIPIIDIIEEPPPPSPFPFGFGIPSITRTTKLRRGIKPRARPRPKRREITIDPFAGLYSVHVSEFAFGKATHPARTKEEKEKFKKRILGGAQIFPTVEMEKFRLGKLKL